MDSLADRDHRLSAFNFICSSYIMGPVVIRCFGNRLEQKSPCPTLCRSIVSDRRSKIYKHEALV